MLPATVTRKNEESSVPPVAQVCADALPDWLIRLVYFRLVPFSAYSCLFPVGLLLPLLFFLLLLL